jgi:hypothetical protein
MAHFAQLDENNIVTQVIVVADNNCLDSEGKESEEIGIAFCNNLLGGRWVQTSYNNSIRKRYAGLGFTYNEELDIFIAPQPNSDYVLNANYDWVSLESL